MSHDTNTESTETHEPTNEHATDRDDEDDGQRELSFDEQTQRARRARQATKTLRFEYDDGAYVDYEYRMIDEDEEEELRQEHSRDYRGRDGEITTELDRKALNVGLIKKAVVDGPQGFKKTRQVIEEGTTPEQRNQLAEAIQSFSRMDEVERRKFRGVGDG